MYNPVPYFLLLVEFNGAGIESSVAMLNPARKDANEGPESSGWEDESVAWKTLEVGTNYWRNLRSLGRDLRKAYSWLTPMPCCCISARNEETWWLSPDVNFGAFDTWFSRLESAARLRGSIIWESWPPWDALTWVEFAGWNSSVLSLEIMALEECMSDTIFSSLVICGLPELLTA